MSGGVGQKLCLPSYQTHVCKWRLVLFSHAHFKRARFLDTAHPNDVEQNGSSCKPESVAADSQESLLACLTVVVSSAISSPTPLYGQSSGTEMHNWERM